MASALIVCDWMLLFIPFFSLCASTESMDSCFIMDAYFWHAIAGAATSLASSFFESFAKSCEASVVPNDYFDPRFVGSRWFARVSFLWMCLLCSSAYIVVFPSPFLRIIDPSLLGWCVKRKTRRRRKTKLAHRKIDQRAITTAVPSPSSRIDCVVTNRIRKKRSYRVPNSLCNRLDKQVGWFTGTYGWEWGGGGL